MLHLLNMPLSDYVLDEFGSADAFSDFCKACGCAGIEAVWGGEDCRFPMPQELIRGWHLAFYTDWLDFWLEDRSALDRKFGSKDVWSDFYNGNSRDALLQYYHNDFERAQQSGVEYVVFHVSDVSIEEGFTYKWLHSDTAVIDAAADMLNQLLDGRDYQFKLLLENLHWSGFTFTAPDLTARLLERVHYPKKGIMLDTGHLLCTNTDLRDQRDGIEYIHRMLDLHGSLTQYINGLHLHQSISGKYVQQHTGTLPELPDDYYERYAYSYSHILQIDTHQPWTEPAVADLVARIKPDYLVHELSASSAAAKMAAIQAQLAALK